MSLVEQLKPLAKIKGSGFENLVNLLDENDKNYLQKNKDKLSPIFNASPYLLDIAQKDSDFLLQALKRPFAANKEKIFTELIGFAKENKSEEELSNRLRIGKRRLALLLALAEIGGAIKIKQTIEILSEFADFALQIALDFLMRQAANEGKINLSEHEACAANSGLAIFALGKHGGRELNYSSDIDIVAFFDIEKNILKVPYEAVKFYSRIVRKLVCLIDDRSELGYVFRTDLRLRPDPSSTPIAMSIDSALAYYEQRGQNWERAAWIKARLAAGDSEVGDYFLEQLTPFIWRKHLDFATIADIQAMKRQINISKNVGHARLEGHNVKLGRGGIREIEFFAQTQQLIAGGRDLSLRVRPTIKALSALANAKWISRAAQKDLTKAYYFLREVENKLQMLRDEQTHIMPESHQNIEIIAKLMGEENIDNFKQKYQATLSIVIKYYSELFVEQSSLASDIGDLVFTGSDDDPATLESLRLLGFKDAKLASQTIRKWHYGSYPATRAAQSRAHLTELLPSLLKIIAQTGNADEALARFDHFLSQFPAGVQLFSLLRSSDDICRTLIAFMASAPKMADEVIHRAHVMDGLIDPAFADGIAQKPILKEKIEGFLAQANSFEDLIDRARIIAQEQKFLISAGFISATISAKQAGEQFSFLAEIILQIIFDAVRKNFAKKHGGFKGAKSALLAFGKMGSREMTATSDLDFILLYDAPVNSEYSDGEKPLALNQYFSRLTQRLVAALSAPTAQGVLYETDMRLRPSGNAGPLATSLKAFINYQQEKAWTWEHLALTRARVVAGDDDLAEKITKVKEQILSQGFCKEKLIKDMLEMREKISQERKPKHQFDLKLIKGGLIDIEFFAQLLMLIEGKKLAISEANIEKIIKKAGELKLIDEADRLIEIHEKYIIILQAMSACLPNPMDMNSWSKAFKNLLAQLTNYPDFELLEKDIGKLSQTVTKITAQYYSF